MIKTGISFVIALFCFVQAFSQTQKFDMAMFTPPQGWQRVDTAGTVAFIHSKNTNGLASFCQIILYPSTTSTGNAGKDFKTAWNNLVTIPANTKAKPVTQKQKKGDGWSIVSGKADIISGTLQYTSSVTAISGFGKTMNVQVNRSLNNYSDIVEIFFGSLTLDSKVAAAKNNSFHNSNQLSMNTNAISLADYDFITPDGWQLQKNKDHFSIQNMGSGCFIKILEPQSSSGDLEKDASAVFDLMYAGWQYQKTGEQKFILSKGFLSRGLEYCRMEAPMSMTGAEGNYNVEEGSALAVKAGNQIVIIAERHNTSMMAHDACYRNYNTLKRFFNSFTVKNAAVPKNGEDVFSGIIGAWSQTESGASSEYVFAANGNYALIGAIGSTHTTSDYRYEYLHIKTYAFQGDGTYSINGNQLTLGKRIGNTEQVKFRFEKANHGGTGWQDRLYLLKQDAGGAYEVCYEKKEK